MNWLRKKSIIERLFWLLIAFGLLGRLLVVPYGVYVNDMKYWVDWGHTLVTENFSTYFTFGWTDRLPGGILYVLWLVAELQKLITGLSNEFVYKLPANMADVVLAYLIFRLVAKRWGERKGLVAAALYFFNPFVWHVSALWGQMDSVQVLLMLLVLLALFRNWYGVATGLLVYAVQFKPHSVFLTPLILIYLWQTKKGSKDFVRKVGLVMLVSLTVWWVLSVPFLPYTADYSSDGAKILGPYQLSWQQFKIAKEAYPYSSVNAFNLWGFLKTSWKSDSQVWLGVTHGWWGLAFFSVAVMLVMWSLWRKRGRPVFEDYGFALGLIFLFGFAFLTRVHERHVLPFFFFYLLGVWFYGYRLKVYLILSLLAVANSWYSFGWLLGEPWINPNGVIMSLLSLVVLLLVVMELYCLVDQIRGRV